jgi:hypothetical protein
MHEEENLREMASQNKIFWRGHALRRMLERNISRAEVKAAFSNCRIIEDYPDDFPFRSFLVLGYSEGRPLHIVCSINEGNIWVITAYIPDPNEWGNDLESRRR